MKPEMKPEMKTERLYEQDAYLTQFRATVRACTPAPQGWEVVLDRTAFYPEGGGQPGDTGTLGGVAVLDTRQRAADVVHLCDGPLEPGAAVEGRIDWARRFDHMCQHSGEHIVSGLICARFGCDNVGFHLGAAEVVIDFNHRISAALLAEIEGEANRVIRENRPFLVSHPDPDALARLSYRSKKALSGDVRIVECPGADRCACCGTHVRTAGELGLIKLTGAKPFRDGTRITLLAGQRAYDYVCMAAEQNHRVSVLTSAKPSETAAAVERLLAELAEVKYRAVGLENRLFARAAAEQAGKGDVVLFDADALPPDGLRRLCEAVTAVCGGRCAVFSSGAAAPDQAGKAVFHYAIGCREGDLRPFAKELNAALRGRGGGKPGFVQGSVRASREEIEAYLRRFFMSLHPELEREKIVCS